MVIYLFFVLALSIDTFIAALTYEGSKIKIPFSSNLVISIICALSLIISLFLGKYFNHIIPNNILKYISFSILFIIGIIKIFDSQIKKIIKKIKSKKLNFSFFNLNFIIEVYSNYESADYDKSKRLSTHEAIYLAFALSIDSLSSGLAFNADYIYFLPIFIFSILVNSLAILSSKIIKKINFDFSLIGGFIFIVFAFLKL